MEENPDVIKYSKLYNKLFYVQQNLKVPKDRRANFKTQGGYNYRSLEDILNAAKPLLNESKLILTLSDDIETINDTNFIKAIATVIDIDGTGVISKVAYAQIATDKKGMDVAQMTGSASSYARKYALNGLLAIDDSEDIDSMDHSNNGGAVAKKTSTKAKKQTTNKSSASISDAQVRRMFALSGGDKEMCLRVISKYGYSCGNEVKISDYNAICDAVVEERKKENNGETDEVQQIQSSQDES